MSSCLKQGFELMMLKYGVCFISLDILVQVQSSSGNSKITLHAKLTPAVL